MSLPRRLAAPLLLGALLLPTAASLAQDDSSDGWVVSDDGLAFATNDTFDIPPVWSRVESSEFPAAIAAIPGPDVLYRLDGTLESGTRIAGLHDGATLPWLDEGRTPVLAKAIVDDDGAAWTRLQHIVSTPAGCSDAAASMDQCIHPSLTGALADLAAPADTPVDSAPFADRFGPGVFASTGVTDRDGTIFSFAGGATVGTTVRVRDDDTIAVRGNVDIGDGLGGQLRGFDAIIVPVPTGGPITLPGWGPLEERARDVRASWMKHGKTLDHRLVCPSSREGYVVSQFLIGGAGQNVGPAVDRSLEGGVPVLISEVIPFDCGPDAWPDPAAGLPDGPAAALVCGSTRARHVPFTSTVDGANVAFPSSLEELYALVTIGFPPDTAARLNARVGGANGGRFFSVPLEGIPLDPASRAAVLWLGESQVGIDGYGPKAYRDLELAMDGSTFDLGGQQRQLFGDAFEVGPSQKPVTNCPEFEFTFDDVPAHFPAGPELGEISTWSTPVAD